MRLAVAGLSSDVRMRPAPTEAARGCPLGAPDTEQHVERAVGQCGHRRILAQQSRCLTAQRPSHLGQHVGEGGPAPIEVRADQFEVAGLVARHEGGAHSPRKGGVEPGQLLDHQLRPAQRQDGRTRRTPDRLGRSQEGPDHHRRHGEIARKAAMVLAERHPVEARPLGRLCLVTKAVDGTRRVAFGQMQPERHRAAAQRLPPALTPRPRCRRTCAPPRPGVLGCDGWERPPGWACSRPGCDAPS